ncbi:MAG: nucleotidyltransferase [Bryobacteraceae bacterium]
MTDFRALLTTLHVKRVEFIIVGGAAAVAHGSVRLTYDLDIVYRRTPENIARLVEALAPVHPYLRGVPPGLPFQWDAESLHRGLNFTLVTDIGDIDVLGEITGGGGYEDLLPHSIVLNLFETASPCLNLNKLIQVKRAAGRVKDFEAVAELEVIAEETGEDLE